MHFTASTGRLKVIVCTLGCQYHQTFSLVFFKTSQDKRCMRVLEDSRVEDVLFTARRGLYAVGYVHGWAITEMLIDARKVPMLPGPSSNNNLRPGCMAYPRTACRRAVRGLHMTDSTGSELQRQGWCTAVWTMIAAHGTCWRFPPHTDSTIGLYVAMEDARASITYFSSVRRIRLAWSFDIWTSRHWTLVTVHVPLWTDILPRTRTAKLTTHSPVWAARQQIASNSSPMHAPTALSVYGLTFRCSLQPIILHNVRHPLLFDCLTPG
jgi:hypothetical protein